MDYNFIQETEFELKMKQFFNNIKNFYGEDTALSIAFSKPSITEALECNGLDLDYITDKEVYLSLIKSYILSAKMDLSFLKDLTDDDKNIFFEDTLNLLKKSKVYKKKVINNFIDNSSFRNFSLLANNQNVSNSLKSLDYLSNYINKDKKEKVR